MECAKSYGAEYIVTRNVSDYSVSNIKAIKPSDYLGLLGNCETRDARSQT